MDFYSDNPLFADPLFTPASTALRSGMRSNSAFEETQAADLATFTGGSAYGAAGFGAQAALPHSSSRQRQPGAFDPDPRLFGPAAEVAEAAVLQDEVQAIVLAGDALQPPTSTTSALMQSPPGALTRLQVIDPQQALSGCCHIVMPVSNAACTLRAGAQSGHDTRQGAPEDIAFADVLGALMRNQVCAASSSMQNDTLPYPPSAKSRHAGCHQTYEEDFCAAFAADRRAGCSAAVCSHLQRAGPGAAGCSCRPAAARRPLPRAAR